MQQKQEFIKQKGNQNGGDADDSMVSAEELSRFYKQFLDDNYELHQNYNWYVSGIVVGTLYSQSVGYEFGPLQATHAHMLLSSSSIIWCQLNLVGKWTQSVADSKGRVVGTPLP